MTVEEIKSKTHFNKRINDSGGTLIVVDYFAPWYQSCCSSVEPNIQKFSEEYSDVTFVKIDIDQLGDLAAELGVAFMPTIQFYKDGKKVHQFEWTDGVELRAKIQTYK